MSIKMKDIIKSEYDGRRCKGFEYFLKLDNQKQCRFIFSANDSGHRNWSLYCLIPDNFSDKNRCVGFGFSVPRDDMPLTTICTIGLKLFQNQIKGEVQVYTDMDSLIGCLIRGEIE